MTEEMKEHITKYHNGSFDLAQCKKCGKWDQEFDPKNKKDHICYCCHRKRIDKQLKDEEYQKAIAKLTYDDKKILGIM